MPTLSVKADAGVGAIAMSPGGRDVVLASRDGVYVLDLKDPFSLPRWLPLRSAAEVSNIQWCPDSRHPTWIVSASNATAIVWNLALPSHRAVEHVLHGHRRAVTDINFSPLRPDLVATCSIDTTVRAWDLRTPQHPALVFEDFVAGAAQAKWSRNNPHELVSAHDNRWVVWDDRRNNEPVLSVRAHTGKLNGLSFDRDGHVLTCSTDRTVKLWDSAHPQKPLGVVVTQFPVWRANPTPVGRGCLITPLRGGSNSVWLADLTSVTERQDPVSIDEITAQHLSGHDAPVRDAIYRRSDTPDCSWDVVTWSKDSHLRLWAIPNEDMAHVIHPGTESEMQPVRPPLSDVSYHAEPPETDRLGSSRTFFDLPFVIGRDRPPVAQLDWIAGVRIGGSSGSPPNTRGDVAGDTAHLRSKQRAGGSAGARARQSRMTLGVRRSETSPASQRPASGFSREVTHVSATIPRIVFETIDVATGLCVLMLRGPAIAPGSEEHAVIRVVVRFPSGYPWESLRATVEEDPNVPPQTIAEMDVALENAAAELAKHGAPALEYCVRFLIGERPQIADYMAIGPATGVSDSDSDGSFHDGYHSDDSDDSDITDEVGTGLSASVGTVDSDIEPSTAMLAGAKPTVDSTPLPRYCGAMWSTMGVLVTFWNPRPAEDSTETTGADPVPLDRVFGDSDDSDASDQMFESDSDDFEVPGARKSVAGTADWSAAAVRLTTAARHLGSPVPAGASGQLSEEESSIPANGSSKQSTMAPENKIKLVDFAHLMPCRIDVARRYRIDFSDSRDPLSLAAHNANVAQELGLWEDAYFWRLGGAYLSIGRSDVPVVAGMPMPSALLPFVNDWTVHPLGPSAVLAAAAENLERQHKFQLLASMACLLTSFRRRQILQAEELAAQRADAYEFPDAQTETLFTLHMHSPGVAGPTLDVVPESQLARPLMTSAASPARADTPTPAWQWDLSGVPRPTLSRHNTQASTQGSIHSSDDTSSIAPTSVASSHVGTLTGPTSGVSGLSGSGSGSGVASGTVSGATSVFGPNSSLAVTTPSTTSLWPGGGSTGGPGGNMSHIGSDYGTPDPATTYTKPRMSLTVLNAAIYDAECVSGADATQTAKTPAAWEEWRPRLEYWRRIYAGFLGAWGLDTTRLEVLKGVASDDTHAYSVSVDMRRDMCIYCQRAVRTRFSHCSICRHIMHASCSEQWWASGESECASGCGCRCRNLSI